MTIEQRIEKLERTNSLWRLATIGLVLLPVTAATVSCSNRRPPVLSMEEQREAVILTSVGDFKTELVKLSRAHSGLAGVGQFAHSHLGFAFVNDNVKPPVRISLCVEDGRLSEMQAIPVGAEELPNEQVVCALQLECEGRPELKAAIEKLYVQFKATLPENLAQKPSNKPDAGDGTKKGAQLFLVSCHIITPTKRAASPFLPDVPFFPACQAGFGVTTY